MTGFYRHKNALDVYIEIHRHSLDANSDHLVFITWWNKSTHGKPWAIQDMYITIQKQHLDNWKPCDANGVIIEST